MVNLCLQSYTFCLKFILYLVFTCLDPGFTTLLTLLSDNKSVSVMEVIDGTFIVKNKCRLQSEFNLVIL